MKQIIVPSWQMIQKNESVNTTAILKMRTIATLLLAVVTALFLLSLKIPQDNQWNGLLRAFSEAAMVGALADWFAVSALFRHPLGLPIPHTAIIPRNKDRIGENFGTFVQKNFLSSELIEKKLQGTDVAGKVSAWMADTANARFIVEKVSVVVPPILETLSEREVNDVLFDGIKKQLESVAIAPIIGKLLRIVVSGDRNKVISNELLNILGQLVEENKVLIRKKVKEESPWFVPEFIDNKIYEKIITQLRNLILEIKQNPNHEVRATFATKMLEFVDGLSTSPEYCEIGEIIKEELLGSEAVKDAFFSLCHDLKENFERGLQEGESAVRERIAGVVTSIAGVINRDESLRSKINGWIRAGILAVLHQHSHQIAEMISETVKNWDSSTLVDKFELEIGRDLQFIRINGTIVGGIIGILIFTLETYLRG